MFQTAFMVCNIMKTYKISPNYLRFFLDISTIYEAYGYEGCDSEYTELCSLNFATQQRSPPGKRIPAPPVSRILPRPPTPYQRKLPLRPELLVGRNIAPLRRRLAGRHKRNLRMPTLPGNLERPVRRRIQRHHRCCRIRNHRNRIKQPLQQLERQKARRLTCLSKQQTRHERTFNGHRKNQPHHTAPAA